MENSAIAVLRQPCHSPAPAAVGSPRDCNGDHGGNSWRESRDSVGGQRSHALFLDVAWRSVGEVGGEAEVTCTCDLGLLRNLLSKRW